MSYSEIGDLRHEAKFKFVCRTCSKKFENDLGRCSCGGTIRDLTNEEVIADYRREKNIREPRRTRSMDHGTSNVGFLKGI